MLIHIVGMSEKLLIVKMHNLWDTCVRVCVCVCVCIPARHVFYFLLFHCVGEYDLAFLSGLTQSTTSKNCKDVKLQWNLLGGNNILYIISVYSFKVVQSGTGISYMVWYSCHDIVV